MRLIRTGVTGFGGAATPPVELARFKTTLYQAARAAGARVLAVHAVHAGNNHHRGELDDGLAVLCNVPCGIVGFVADGRFVERPALAAVFEAAGHLVADPAALDRALDDDDLAALWEGELKQLRYWKPQRVSQVVFNTWD